MKVVMPSVVRHSEMWPYLSMARFETGGGGNPHYHGFSVGLRGPVMNRVKAKDEGQEDMPPVTCSSDVMVFKSWLLNGDGRMQLDYDEDFSRESLLGLIRSALISERQDGLSEGESDYEDDDDDVDGDGVGDDENGDVDVVGDVADSGLALEHEGRDNVGDEISDPSGCIGARGACNAGFGSDSGGGLGLSLRVRAVLDDLISSVFVRNLIKSQ